MRFPTLHVASLLLFAYASAGAQDAWSYLPRTNALELRNDDHLEFTATVVGLALLTRYALPHAYREYRFEIECALCLPTYLIRLRINPGGKIVGNAYMLWFDKDSSAAQDTSVRARRINAPPNNCASDLKDSKGGKGFEYTWCNARLSRDLKWRRLVAQLDSLGVFKLPTTSGYSPDPPNLGIDTVRFGDKTVFAPRHDCGDIASKSLRMSFLVGAEYRSAYFWCLESKAPGNPEHSRVAKAYQLLSNAIVSYSDTVRQ